MTRRRDNYERFIDSKTQLVGKFGFDPIELPRVLFPFQRDLVVWALQKGRGAIFADCGMGKTLIQLVWADNVCRYTSGRVLILTPLAVSIQTKAEADHFMIDADRSRRGEKIAAPIIITNYEQLEHFNPTDFVGCVCDESSILKNFNGKTREAITRFMMKMKYRLLCTATPSPNDYTELGTSSEALGHTGFIDMLGMFFRNEQGNVATGRQWGGAVKWRFKKHGEQSFWRWVCSWSRSARQPSDLGHDNDEFVLPALTERETIIKASRPRDGMLFDLPASTIQELHEERRRTIPERIEAVRAVTTTDKPSVVWCHLNDESNLAEQIIEDAVQVSGRDKDITKEEKLMAFARGDIRVLVTKPRIGGFGMNWQHCAHMTFFPSHSYEQYYQAVRRCWRFGQRSDVAVDIISSEGEAGALASLSRKAAAADKMFSNLVQYMRDYQTAKKTLQFTKELEVPSWLYQNKK